MFTFSSPAEYAAGLIRNCIPALNHHCENQSCDSCPYGPADSLHDSCTNVLISQLPSILRAHGDDRSMQLADRLDRCAQFDPSLCRSCEHFTRCHADENMDYILSDVHRHLCAISACKEES